MRKGWLAWPAPQCTKEAHGFSTTTTEKRVRLQPAGCSGDGDNLSNYGVFTTNLSRLIAETLTVIRFATLPRRRECDQQIVVVDDTLATMQS